MHPLAHHAGEETLAALLLLLLGGAWLSVLVAYSRARLASVRARLARKQGHRPGGQASLIMGIDKARAHRALCVDRSDPRPAHPPWSAGPPLSLDPPVCGPVGRISWLSTVQLAASTCRMTSRVRSGTSCGGCSWPTPSHLTSVAFGMPLARTSAWS
jgi:hypothetical protein